MKSHFWEDIRNKEENKRLNLIHHFLMGLFDKKMYLMWIMEINI